MTIQRMRAAIYRKPNEKGVYQWFYNIEQEARNPAEDPGGHGILHVGDQGYDTDLQAVEAAHLHIGK